MKNPESGGYRNKLAEQLKTIRKKEDHRDEMERLLSEEKKTLAYTAAIKEEVLGADFHENQNEEKGKSLFDEREFIRVLNDATRTVYDINALPLGIDARYGMMKEFLTSHCGEAVELFFKKAREGSPEEKLFYASLLMRLSFNADSQAFDQALAENMTNRKTIEAMYQEAAKAEGLPDERTDVKVGLGEKLSFWAQTVKSMVTSWFKKE